MNFNFSFIQNPVRLNAINEHKQSQCAVQDGPVVLWCEEESRIIGSHNRCE